MNKTKIPLIVLLGILAFSACEKDDICIDNDTPRLVIRFYDIGDTTEIKEVQNLVVRGLDENGIRDTISNLALDSIALPLRIDATSTSFSLQRMPGETNTDSIDTITFNYDTREVFASRACGYIVNYANLQVNLAQTDSESLWIKGITIVDSLIENSASAHVKIFH